MFHKSSGKKNESWERTQSRDQFVNGQFVQMFLRRKSESAEHDASGRTLQTVGAAWLNARLANSVLTTIHLYSPYNMVAQATQENTTNEKWSWW